MRLATAIAIAAMALSLGVQDAGAQGIGDTQPAEYPPASYTGKQYVDSKGCVFVRAGFDGAVTWVPRVNRKRKVLCGFAPTLASRPEPEPEPENRLAAVPAPKPPAPVIAPVRIPVTAAPAPRQETAPRAAIVPPPRVPARGAAPTPAKVAPARGVAPAKAVPARRVAPARVAPPRAVAAPAPAGKPVCGATELSRRYLQGTSRHPVRCGPQAESPTGSYRLNHLGGSGLINPPAGYRLAWEDGRLNPNRGPRTAVGDAQAALIWTQTVPQELVAQPGRPAAAAPARETTRLSTKAQPPARAVAPVRERTRVSTKVRPPARAIAPAPPRAAAPGHRYVQAGVFGVPANAERTARRLQALGLPVRMSSYSKSGKTYRVVLAGPFGSADALRSGLGAVRRAGFADAFTRR